MVEELHIDDQRTLEMVAQFAEQAAKATQNSSVSDIYILHWFNLKVNSTYLHFKVSLFIFKGNFFYRLQVT